MVDWGPPYKLLLQLKYLVKARTLTRRSLRAANYVCDYDNDYDYYDHTHHYHEYHHDHHYGGASILYWS